MSQETTTQRQGFLRRNLWVVLAAAVLAAACLGAGLQQAERSRELTQQEQEISDLEKRLKSVEQKSEEAADKNAYEALGMSPKRLVADREIIEAVLGTALSWKDSASYEEARSELVDRFGIDEKGPFLTEFMPPAKVGAKGVDHIEASALVFDYDAIASADPVRVVGTKYDYVVVAHVDVSSSAVRPGSDGQTPTETRRVLVRITVDGEGAVSGLTGVPAAGRTLSSE